MRKEREKKLIIVNVKKEYEDRVIGGECENVTDKDIYDASLQISNIIMGEALTSLMEE